MQIDLPEDLIRRLMERTSTGKSKADVLRDAMDALDWLEGEVAAIQEGIDAMQNDQVQALEDFDREFRVGQGL
ncbi:hypothetical protein AB1K70_08660 [Bremerella sp. JC770]|uniref:hypothetical protein n=1 Tax=Bremerella sp. JC770 TaxID=3232137 RepID=UPI003457B387